MWNYQLDFWASTKGHPVHTLDVNSVTLDQSVASPLNHNGDGTLLSFPYWNSKPSCPKFFRSRVSPWFPVVMGYPASSSRHGPLFVLKHGDMVTPGGHPGTDPGKPSSSSCTVSWSRRSQTVFGEFSDANRGKSGYKWFLFWHSSWFLWKVIFFNYILTVFPVSEVPSVYSIPRPHPNSFRNDEYFWSRGGWKLQISWHRQW